MLDTAENVDAAYYNTAIGTINNIYLSYSGTSWKQTSGSDSGGSYLLFYSNNHTHSSTSQMRIYCTGAGYSELYYRTSTESCCDKLTISGPVSVSNKGGINSDFTRVTFNYTSSTYLYFKYSKDGSVHSGDDTVYVKIYLNKAGFESGSGTSSSPYIIKTLAQLQFFANQVNNGTTYSGQYIRLGANISLPSSNWTPIGTSSRYFRGTFDGNGYTISNLYIYYSSSTNYQGLFGYVYYATIKNLTLSINTLRAGSYLGGIAGYSYETVFDNCKVSGSISGYNANYVGGICGYANYSEFEDCGYTSVWDIFASELDKRFSLPTFPVLDISNFMAPCTVCFIY